MKMARKICIVVVIGVIIAAFTGCASAPNRTGSLDDTYGDPGLGGD